MPNQLSGELSPYLLQHANNPVNWYPWNEKALRKAKEEDKPVLVSIGYSACHWCHVMERESFEDIETARIMNENFVNIKIDREERPDLDHIYMDAVQAMTGSGGWPLNVFLTPEGKPFYGGTYFPPKRLYNRPSWKDVLQSVVTAFREKRKELETQAETLLVHIAESNAPGKKNTKDGDDIFDKENLQVIYENIMKTADKEDGGFGHAPKFPQTFIIHFLLQHYYFTKNEEALKQSALSLDSMIHGGIYDQIGGGFARYATDNKWLVPHFEKMLYDNALLVTVISEIFQLTGHDHYRVALTQTMKFVAEDMLSPEGGFYTAWDADSEGEEGRYYVWEKPEIDSILQEDAALFCAYYNVSDRGNWEGKNILHVQMSEDEFARKENMNPDEVKKKLMLCREKLLMRRKLRVSPLLDDKILMGWNALMSIACCKAYAALGIEEYRQLAIRNIDFIWKKFKGNGVYHFHHSYKNGKTTIPAFLDDYAYLIAALIQLQEVTGNLSWLEKAEELTDWVIEHFSEEGTGYFFYTHKDQQDIIIRKKEVYDGATPSGNAVMAVNLFYLSVVFNRPEWKERALSGCQSLIRLIINYPGSFGQWATLLQAIAYGTVEIVITGKESDKICKEFLSNFIPHRVFQSATSKNDQFPLLRDKPVLQHPLIFLCQEYSCQTPVTEIHELIRLLETVQKINN
ncbi:MAG TPA: thioredoxin domain-containing protein [Puia sp.]|nr:thioredoxin domain-containing protein [Puia sp.]